jgi:hypothetical protein
VSYGEEVEATEAKMNAAKVDRAPTNQVATNLAVPDALRQRPAAARRVSVSGFPFKRRICFTWCWLCTQ